ncbi:hypothetical protein UFOVP653_45 [uncultured Caudovirales phage]|uniref:Uncharacterized protein n=1 Tax=uncultured Caudovirales phage TaxID=2100421 RepID=A0A6J5NA57_9CAUD|nr:hypothetical protein UFOVP653_45 [uncultured Caudovirales phage]
MTNAIEFTTGRTYDTAQVLAISVESDVAGDFGFRDVTAVFSDASRHISGRVEIVLVGNDPIGPAVLAAYDAGQYQAL